MPLFAVGFCVFNFVLCVKEKAETERECLEGFH